MSYAIKKDGSGWRRVVDASACGQDESWQAIAPLPIVQSARSTEIKLALLTIDQKKIRALTDALLSGDKTRVQALETQAAALRSELATL